MKKILVPTDFSENATNAVDYAVGLARHFGSSIHLLHTYQVQSSTGSFIDVERFILEDAEQTMQENIRRIQQKWPEHTKITYQILRGYAVPIIAKLAQHFDLIVMGSQGESKLKEIFLGSTTNGVMKKTGTPVLAIPAHFSYRPLKTIVFAVDDPATIEEALLIHLKELALAFGAILRVFHVVEEEEKVMEIDANRAIGKQFSDVDVSYHFTPGDANINTNINRFIREVDADLLCMIPRKRNFLNSLFFQSVTRREIFQSEVPVLILPAVVAVLTH